MDDNHQDKTGSKPTTEDKIWLPPLSPKDQEKLDHRRNNPKKVVVKGTGFADKTLWDWLQLLIIPFVLAVGGFWFSAQQNQISLQISERQHQIDLQIAEDQQKETALQNYLDHMSDLILNEKLLSSKPGDAVREVARTRTLTILSGLDPRRKGVVLQFLFRSGLIWRHTTYSFIKNVIIDLHGADLRGVDLSGVKEAPIDVSVSYDPTMVGESPGVGGGVDLIGADLSYTFMSNAKLNNAILIGADLSDADLRDADLSHADLGSATLGEANLIGAKLRGASMPDGSIHP